MPTFPKKCVCARLFWAPGTSSTLCPQQSFPGDRSHVPPPAALWQVPAWGLGTEQGWLSLPLSPGEGRWVEDRFSLRTHHTLGGRRLHALSSVSCKQALTPPSLSEDVEDVEDASFREEVVLSPVPSALRLHIASKPIDLSVAKVGADLKVRVDTSRSEWV